MLKKILLGGGSFAVILAAFLLYSSMTTSPGRPRRTKVTPPTMPTVTAPGAGGATLRGMPVASGSKPVVKHYTRSGRVKYELSADFWEPAGRDEFHLKGPRVTLFAPAGQIIRIEATEGIVGVKQTDRRNLDPKRGTLSGKVHVAIDRTTYAWREAHPAEVRMMDHPDEVIHIWLDQVRFDLEHAHIESAGELLVQAAEAEVRGEGLRLVWNEVDNRIEELIIEKGESMELRRGAAEFGIDTQLRDQPTAPDEPPPATRPGDDAPETFEPIPTPQQDLAAARTATRPASAPAVADNRMRLTATRRAERAEKPAVTYLATFDGGVKVVQIAPGQPPASVTAQRLALTFDIGEQDRAMASRSTSRPTTTRGATPAPDGSRLRLTWGGRLVLKPVPVAPGTGPLPPVGGRRFDVEATGSPVVVTDRQGTIVCQRLVHHDRTKRVWLFGSEEQPVRLDAGSGVVTGRLMWLDRRRGIVRIDGPGTMLESRKDPRREGILGRFTRAARSTPSPQRVDVSWRQGVMLRMGRATVPRADRLGRPEPRSVEYLRLASFQGDVRMVQVERSRAAATTGPAAEPSSQSIRADCVTMRFDPPARAGAAGVGRNLAELLGRVDAYGDVELVRTQPSRLIGKPLTDRITCGKLLVHMTPDADGRRVPDKAHAFGDVVAEKGRRRIAADHIAVAFAPMDETDGAAKPSRRLNISQLDAFDNVEARDPAERLNLKAQELHCRLAPGQKIETALLIGTPAAPAVVSLRDYGAAGARIDIDVPHQRMSVPGAGSMRLITRQDLSGRRASRPEPLDIVWNERMTLRGDRNVGHFVGAVRATSAGHVLTCDRLRVDFEDLPEPGPRASLPEDDRFWVFNRLIRSRAAEQREVLSGSVRKRAVYVQARGSADGKTQALALSTDHDPSTRRIVSRGRLAGPSLVYDLRRRQLDVDGAGSLLLEDYRIKRRVATQGADATGGLGWLGQTQSTSPSQTVIVWSNSMTYFMPRNLAIFDRDVQMVHRGGSAMALGQEIAEALGADVEKLRAVPARRANLTCDNLLVQFRSRDGDADPTVGGLAAQSDASALDRLVASGAVHLAEGARTLMGERLAYSRRSGAVTVTGTPQQEARIFNQDAPSGQFFMWRGPQLRWYPKDDRIEAPHAKIITSGG